MIFPRTRRTPGHIEAYIRLRAVNALTTRVMLALEAEGYAYPPHWPYSLEQFEERLDFGRRMLDLDDEFLRITGITFSPATPCGSGMARMHDPYRGPFGESTRGVTFLSREKQRRFICFCAEHAIRGNFCTYGYRDHDDILEDLESEIGKSGLKDHSWLIQHALVITQRQAERYAALGCTLTTSMAFSWGKGDLWGERIGKHVWRDQVPLKRLLRAGLTVGAGSDWGPKNPWEQMQLAETHEFAGSGYRNATPDHVASREEAKLIRLVQSDEVWAVHGGWIASANPKLGPGVRARFATASRLDPDEVKAARALRERIRTRMRELVADGGVLVFPTAPGVAPLRNLPDEDLQEFRLKALALLCPAGHAGLPQISMPLGAVDSLPIGLSIVADQYCDEDLLQLAIQMI